MDLTLTTGDTAPTLTVTCTTAGAPAALAGATAEMHVRRADGTVINRPAVVASAAEGVVTMEWEPGDLTVPGRYEVETQVTYTNGRVQTFGRSVFVVRRQIA